MLTKQLNSPKSTRNKAEIALQVAELPLRPGCYIFKDSAGKILYVGKAVNLRSRVRSYFASKHTDRPHINSLVPLIDQIETIQTENEVEALILEANLIKKYKPHFNIDLKDGKFYAYIHITTNEKFPRVLKLREARKNLKGRFFGPYPDGRPINRTLKFLRKLYPYCNERVKKGKKACFYYHLEECPGPCAGKISAEDYAKNIQEIIKFLQGKKVNTVQKLEEKMHQLSEKEKFEEAAKLRDRIYDLRYLGQKISLDSGDTEEEFRDIKKKRAERAVSKLFKRLYRIMPADSTGTQQIKKSRIECYDISNIQGTNAVGAMTVAVAGEITKRLYRHFTIKTFDTPNDVGMMEEVLRRRLAYLTPDSKKQLDESLSMRPDLIIVDGGKTQLTAIWKLLHELGQGDIPIIGIAKKLETLWYITPDEGTKRGYHYNYINIARSAHELHLVQNLRDEAHRFSLKHHRLLRLRASKKTVLDKIEGVGPKRKKELLKKFGSIENLKKASFEEINLVVKNQTATAQIINSLKASEESPRSDPK